MKTTIPITVTLFLLAHTAHAQNQARKEGSGIWAISDDKQSYRAALEMICEAPNRFAKKEDIVGISDADRSERMSQWIADRLQNKDAKLLLESLSYASQKTRADLFREEVRKIGIKHCPFADELERYAKPETKKMTYKQAVKQSDKLKKGMTTAQAMKWMGPPDKKEGATWTWDFSRLEGFPGMPPPINTVVFTGVSIELKKGKISYVRKNWLEAEGVEITAPK